MEGIVGRHKVLARPGLVAQRPDDYRRMVDVCMCQLHDACHVGRLKFGHMRQRGITVIILVAFDVGLILQIDAILVAEVVPVRIVGVVRVAHMVDVATLHQHDFLFHLLHRDSVACSRIDFLTVDTFQLHRLAVHVVVASGQSELVFAGRRILDFDLAEAQSGRERLYDTAFLILQLAHQYITIGRLGRPLARTGYGYLRLRTEIATLLHFVQLKCAAYAFHQLIVIRIKLVGVERIGQCISFYRLLAQVTEVGLNTKGAVLIVGIQVGEDAKVAHLHLRRRCQRNGTEDTRQAKHVLRFEEGAVRVTIDLDSHHVVTLLVQIRRDVERSRIARILREPHVMSVNPKVEERRNTVEVDVHLASFPTGRDGERTTVGTYLVAMLVGHPVGRRRTHHAPLPVAHGHLVLEDDRLVGINGHSVLQTAILLDTHHIPLHRHGHIVPSRYIKFGFIKIGRTLLGVTHPMELPVTIQRLIITAVLGQNAPCTFHVGKRKEPRPRLFLVQRQLLGSFPLLACRCLGLTIGETLQSCCLSETTQRSQQENDR